MSFKFKTKWQHKCVTDHKQGDEIEEEFEVEVPQDKFDTAVQERLARKDTEHAEALDKVKIELKAEYDAKVKALGEGGGASEALSKAETQAMIAAAVEEATRKGASEQAKLNMDVMRERIISESGTRIPNTLLAGFTINEGESKDAAAERFKTFLTETETKLKDGGYSNGPAQMGSEGKGAGTTGEAESKALLADARKYYSNTMDNLSDEEMVRIMQNKIARGLHEVGKGPIS